MSFGPFGGEAGPQGIVQPRRPRIPFRLLAIPVALLVGVAVLNAVSGVATDALWFQSVGFGSVYRTQILSQVALFGGGIVFCAVVLLLNLSLARRFTPPGDARALDLPPDFDAMVLWLRSEGARPAVTGGLLVAVAIISLSTGLTWAAHWEDVQLFRHATSFGRTDPQFGRDLGFYVFRLPVYSLVVSSLLWFCLLTGALVTGIYVVRSALYRVSTPGPRLLRRGSFFVPQAIRLHLAVLIAVASGLIALDVWLQRYGLVLSTRGPDDGAFYTDVHATLPMLGVRAVVTLVAGALLIAGVLRTNTRMAVAAVAIGIAGWIASAAYPPIVQRFSVQPNELSREEPYLARNIAATRYAFGLDKVTERQFPAKNEVTEAEVQAAADTIHNVRLWDPEPLRLALSQLQTIRPLFEFVDVDVDRYNIDGDYRQVMLSARELNAGRLPADAQTWVNRTLQFTHGYGYAVAAVNEVLPDGSPSLIVKDIPLSGALSTERPELYFGERPDRYVIVNGAEPEFTPSSAGNVQTRFAGKGGVDLGSLWRRALYAWEFGDFNILISSSLRSDSRLLYRRNIQQRIHKIAPLLRLDNDPYLIIDTSGMYWMQDAYTATDRMPYSHRIGDINYIRNTVKIVVNAYSGDVTFYVVDQDEPIAKAYSRVFPELFSPLSEMPKFLREHIRYPEDLFDYQTQAYLRYHIQDPKQFYRKEDQWDVPTEILGDREQPIRPYYVIAQLPGEPAEEFMLILPFVPRNRTNAIAWMAGRSDPEHYGEIVTYRFPESSSVPGPTQIERRIDSDGRVSQQLTLWNQAGSKVIRGDLLMIPVGNSHLFFEALYLASTTGSNEIPQLKRVVVVNGESVAMEPTLDRALAVLFGRAQPSGLDSGGSSGGQPAVTPTPSPTAAPTPRPADPGPGTPTASALPADVAGLITEASATYDRAQEALKAGDFAGYGRETERLRRILEQLQKLTASPTPTR